ncbi:putative ABC transporter ATP-binding protein [uncultured archaeon]|nr:putative ABC transporter ATP-binding protein [uncultured archaeon]
MAKKVVLELSKVYKSYVMGDSTIHALQDINFKVYEGDLVAIIGPSGSGKSTMLQILGCLDKPSSGSLQIDGLETSKMNEDQLATTRNTKIGFVFQSFFLVPTLDAVQNVALPLMFAGISKSQREARAVKLLKDIGLGDRLYNKPSELSGGQRQRVAIARSLCTNPAIILADEPTGNLDSKTGKEIMDLFKELNKKEKRTIITVTHDMNLAHSNFNKLIKLKDGRIEGEEVVRK